MQSGESMYRERIQDLRSALMRDQEHQERKLQHVQKLIDQSAAYVESVLNMESRIEVLRFHLEPEDYRAAVSKLDSRRKSMHDALISMVSMVNRLCETYLQEKLYQGETDRQSIAKFAFDLVQEFKPEK